MVESQFMRRLAASVFALFVIVSLALGQSTQLSKRQPAPVMGVGGADWLTRPQRIQEEDPDRMLAALEIKSGSVVADVGAGVGYHVWRLSTMVGPAGEVIAEDIQQEMLRRLDKNIEARKIHNVQIVLVR